MPWRNLCWEGSSVGATQSSSSFVLVLDRRVSSEAYEPPRHSIGWHSGLPRDNRIEDEDDDKNEDEKSAAHAAITKPPFER
jgi:hypothetical protein